MKKLIEHIEKFSYVSFDIFDTLIYRLVGNAFNIFSVMELFESDIDLRGFALKRMKAEKMAIEHSEKAEITLQDIYDELEGYSRQEKNIIQQLEIDTEKRFSVLNPEMLKVIDYCMKKKKTIVCISDMYLSRDTIEYLLRSKGIPFKYLFVSSEEQIRKSRGGLYDIALRKMGIAPTEIIHIGDNLKSDAMMPRLRGIASVHYKAEWKPTGRMGWNLVQGLGLQAAAGWTYYKREGFCLFGPLLVGLCQWIHQRVEEEGCDTLHFYSRDGLIIKRAYEILYPGSPGEYLYVSRRSLTVPFLTDARDMGDVLRVIPYIKREETPESLLHKMGIDDEGLIRVVRESFGGHIARKDLSGQYNHTMFEMLSEAVYKEAEQERKLCLKYLKDYYRPSQKAAVVDIGWYGSMQLSVENLLKEAGIECRLIGLYLGLLDKGKESYRSINASGYVYDYRKRDTFDSSYVFGFNGLIESFFTADHGSTKKYCESADGVGAVFELQENKENHSIWKFQEGALEFVKKFRDLTDGYKVRLSREDAYHRLEKLLTNPDKLEIEKFGEIEFFDIYTSKLINAKPLSTYIKNPKEIIRDFSKSDWKLGFIKKIFHMPPRQTYRLIIEAKKG